MSNRFFFPLVLHNFLHAVFLLLKKYNFSANIFCRLKNCRKDEFNSIRNSFLVRMGVLKNKNNKGLAKNIFRTFEQICTGRPHLTPDSWSAASK